MPRSTTSRSARPATRTRSWATARPQRWDLAAERYSAAVTLYEMTLGAGVLPQWGDGKSDPALTDDELVIDAEKFDPSVRDGLVEFFRKALHREPSKRFDNADEMRWAWQQVFKEAEQRKIKTPSGEEVDLRVSLEQADLNTPVAALGLSTRARNALERADVLTVRNLLELPDRRHPPDAGRRQPDPPGDHRLRQRVAGTIPQRRDHDDQGETVTGRALGTAQPGTAAAPDRRDQDSQEGRRVEHPRRLAGTSRGRSRSRPATGPARPTSPTPWTSPVPGSVRSWRRIGTAGAKTRH